MRPATVFTSAARTLTRQQSRALMGRARELIALSRQLVEETRERQQRSIEAQEHSHAFRAERRRRGR